MMKAKRIKYLIIFLTVLALIPAICFAKDEDSNDKLPVEVSASVNKDKVTIGDKITYTLTVKADKDIKIKFPEFGQDLGNFAIKDFGKSEKGWFGTKTYRRWYVLDTYVSGKYLIPSTVIKYRKKGGKEWQEVCSPSSYRLSFNSLRSRRTGKRVHCFRRCYAMYNPFIR